MSENCKDCGKCCIETEMIVSEDDINLIMKECQNHLPKQKFYFKNEDNLLQLKNIEGYCVFFEKNSKTCNIYKYRPQGCKFYPLIFDFERKKCIYDKDCPRTHLFYKRKGTFKRTCKNLRKFLKEQLNLELR
ncbi:MAG: YkgJ family cysteine cluster protein [Candidatus Thorarchaeota archaeon]